MPPHAGTPKQEVAAMTSVVPTSPPLEHSRSRAGSPLDSSDVVSSGEEEFHPGGPAPAVLSRDSSQHVMSHAGIFANGKHVSLITFQSMGRIVMWS